MTTEKDSFPNDSTNESENSFFTNSGSSPTTGNGSSRRPPVVPTPAESGHLVNEAYDRYRAAPNSPDALTDLMREIRNYAERVLSKECTLKRWTSIRLNAEDVIQDALVNIWNGLNTFRSESKFSTWCYGVIRRAAIDTIRRMPKRGVELLTWKAYAEDGGTAHAGYTGSAPNSGNREFLEQEEKRRIADIDFHAILNGLNAIDSQIGELSFVSGYTALEIAEALGKDTIRGAHKCSRGERWVQNRIAAIRRAVDAVERQVHESGHVERKRQSTRTKPA